MSDDASAQPDTGFSDAQMNVILTTAVAVNIVSIICTLAVLGVYIFLRTTRPALVNRTSLRLAVATSVADLLYSGVQIYSDLLKEDGVMCALSVWWYILFTLLTMFLTACVAVNLQVVFLHGRHDARSLEKWYYLGSVVLAIVISGSGYFGKQYGWDELQENCWFTKDGTPESTMWQWSTIYVWLVVVILYCLAVIAAVLVCISKEASNLDVATAMSGIRSQPASTPASPTLPPSPLSPTWPQSPTLGAFAQPVEAASPSVARHMLKKRRRKNLQRILKRIILYPLIPAITQTPNLIVTMQALSLGYNTFFIAWLSFAANSIQGALNCFIFFIDPAVRSGLADYMEERKERKRKQDNVPTMVVTNTETKAPPPAQSGSFGQKWRRQTGGMQDISPTATVIGESAPSPSKGQDYLGVEIETGNWRLAQEEEEEWFKLL